MKKLTQILILTLLTSCLTVRYTIDDFSDQTFVCDNGPMVGKTILKLGKDTFNYSERDSLFIGAGLWSVSQDKRTIHLIGSTTLKDYKNEEFSLRKSLDLELEIKNKNKLIDSSQIFIKQE